MSASIQDNIFTLIESRKSLLIASLNKHNLPEISATPFIKIDHKFYIFISELASHTQNLKARPKLSVMLIEDEQDTKNPFARKRLSYECVASMIDKNAENGQILLDAFEEQQGKTVSLLKQLPDFHLFELTAISGNYIEGFGKAYRLSGENLEHIELQTK
ncbi:MAG: putative heme iron utilization protein [Oleiphilaceae bacterium]|jgi:putative heme iron utilization protein